MENCKHCKPLTNKFSTIGKTYYIVKERGDRSIMCFRHWHQANRPEPIMSGDYGEIIQALKTLRK